MGGEGREGLPGLKGFFPPYKLVGTGGDHLLRVTLEDPIPHVPHHLGLVVDATQGVEKAPKGLKVLLVHVGHHATGELA